MSFRHLCYSGKTKKFYLIEPVDNEFLTNVDTIEAIVVCSHSIFDFQIKPQSIIPCNISTTGITLISSTPFIHSIDDYDNTQHNFLKNYRILAKIGHAIINSMNQLDYSCNKYKKQIQQLELRMNACMKIINDSNNQIASLSHQIDNFETEKKVLYFCVFPYFVAANITN